MKKCNSRNGYYHKSPILDWIGSKQTFKNGYINKWNSRHEVKNAFEYLKGKQQKSKKIHQWHWDYKYNFNHKSAPWRGRFISKISQCCHRVWQNQNQPFCPCTKNLTCSRVLVSYECNSINHCFECAYQWKAKAKQLNLCFDSVWLKHPETEPKLITSFSEQIQQFNAAEVVVVFCFIRSFCIIPFFPYGITLNIFYIS